MLRASHSNHETKHESEINNIAVLKEIKLFFMSNKYKRAESRDCERYNSVLEAHKATLVYLEDEKVHKLFVNDEPLKPQDSIKILTKMIESLQSSNAQNVVELTSGSTNPSYIDTKTHSERDVITTAFVTVEEAHIGADALDSKEAQALTQLKEGYSVPEYATIPRVFGSSLKLEEQYINLQMLCADLKNKKVEGDQESKYLAETKRDEQYKGAHMVSVESLFGDKRGIKAENLSKPARALFDSKEVDLSDAESEHNDDEGDQLEAVKDKNELPRLLLVQGCTGIGKTTFVHHVAHQWSKGQLYASYTWLFTLKLRELRLLPNAKELSFSEWVRISQFGDWEQKEFDELWEQRIEPAIHQNQALLILDGYDEAPENHPCKSILKDLLTSNGTYPNLSLLITTRPCAAGDISEKRRNLEIIGFTDENINQYIQTYFLEAPNKTLVHILTEALRKQPVIWANAHIPFNLNLLCGIMEEAIQKASVEDLTQGLSELSSMTRLYQVTEKKLYERSYAQRDVVSTDRQSTGFQTDFYKHYEKERLFLAKLAFQSFEAERIIIPSQTVEAALQAYADKEMTHNSQQQQGELSEAFFKTVCELGLIKPVLDASGLSETQQDYEFLHSTFQEYYTAIYLAEGLRTEESITKADAEKIISREKYNPRWQMVWWFVAGLLRENSLVYRDYLQQLQGQSKGQTLTQDVLEHYQLGLLTRCVDEGLEPHNQQTIEPIVQQLQHSFLRLYQTAKNVTNNASEAVIPAQSRSSRRFRGGNDSTGIADSNALKNLGFINSPFFSACRISPNFCMSEKGDLYALIPEPGKSKDKGFLLAWIATVRVVTPKALDVLMRLLGDKDNEVSRTAKEILDRLVTAVAATPKTLNKLLVLLAHESSDVRRDASEAVGQLGAAAGTPEILDALAGLLTDKDGDVCRSAAGAVAKLGTVAATPKLLEALAGLLTAKDRDVRCYARKAVGNLGAAAGSPEILNALVGFLADGDGDAAEAMGKLGAAAATPMVLDALVELLANKDSGVRRNAVMVAGRLGAAAATPKVLDALVGLFADEDKWLRKSVVEALDKLGAAAVTPNLLEALLGLFADENWDVRCYARKAVGNLLGAAAATPQVLDTLLGLLADKNRDVRDFAAEAMGKLGAAAATPTVLDLLERRLLVKGWNPRDSSDERRSAAVAVGNLGAAVPTPRVLDMLVGLLADEDDLVCDYAVKAVGRLGTAVTTPMLDALARLLATKDSYLHGDVVETVGNLGAVAGTPEILNALAGLLVSKGGYVHRNVLKSVGNICVAGAAMTPQLLGALAALLAGKERDVCHYVARVINSLGATAKPRLLETLPELLVDEDSNNVHCSAPDVVSELEIAAATSKTLDILVGFLAHEDRHVRGSAAEAMGKLGAAAATEKVLDALAGLLLHEDDWVCVCAAKAVGQLGTAAATPKVLDALLGLLAHKDKWVRGHIAKAVGQLGAVTATPKVLDTLATFLTDEDHDVRNSAAEAVGNLGAVAATPKVLGALVRFLLMHKSIFVCNSFANAISKLGPAAATPEILEVLAGLLEDYSARSSAAEAVGNLGAAAVTPRLLDTLVRLLTDEDAYTRRFAEMVTGQLGVVAATPEILNALAGLLVHESSYVRNSAANVVSKLGAVAAMPKILDALMGLLAHKDIDVRSSATEMLGKLGAAAATPRVLDALKVLLLDESSDVRHSATKVLSNLVVAAATPEILDALTGLLVHESSYVRNSAANAVGKLRAVAATPKVLDALMILLTDKNGDVRRSATKAVGKLGIAAATPKILDALVGLLADKNGDVRSSVIKVLDELGAAIATPKILEALAELLADEDSNVCCPAAEVLSKLGAVTPKLLEGLARFVVDKDERVRRSAAIALAKLAVATRPKLLEELEGAAQYRYGGGRFASEVLHALGTVVTPKELDPLTLDVLTLDTLAALLMHEIRDVRCYAVRVLAILGTAAATPKILEALVELLEDTSSDVRSSAVEALGELGAVAAAPKLLDALAGLLVDESRDVRSSAIKALGELGVFAATPKILEALPGLLMDQNSDASSSAKKVLDKLGAAATPEILDMLVRLLADEDSDVRGTAAEAVGKLSTTVTPKVLDALVRLLGSKYAGVRVSAEKAVNQLCSAVTITEFLHQLLDVYSAGRSDIALRIFGMRIDSVFTLMPSFFAENANHPNLFAFVSYTLAAAYLNSSISCQIDFDKEGESEDYCMRGLVGKSSYRLLITPAQAQCFRCLSLLIIEQLSKTGRLDLVDLKASFPEWEAIAQSLGRESGNVTIHLPANLASFIIERLSKTGRLDVADLKANFPAWEAIAESLFLTNPQLARESGSVTMHLPPSLESASEQKGPPILTQYQQGSQRTSEVEASQNYRRTSNVCRIS